MRRLGEPIQKAFCPEAHQNVLKTLSVLLRMIKQALADGRRDVAHYPTLHVSDSR
jgi:hypothetical protein